MNFGEIAHSILAPIGYDPARYRELSDDDLRTLHHAQRGANLVLIERLAEVVGGLDVARRFVEVAGKLTRETRARFCKDFGDQPEGAPLRPGLFAAHISAGLGMEEMLALEIERRASGRAN